MQCTTNDSDIGRNNMMEFSVIEMMTDQLRRKFGNKKLFITYDGDNKIAKICKKCHLQVEYSRDPNHELKSIIRALSNNSKKNKEQSGKIIFIMELKAE